MTYIYHICSCMMHICAIYDCSVWGTGCGERVSGAWHLPCDWHTAHADTMCSISLLTPNQYTLCLARLLHFSIPKWPSWIVHSTLFSIDFGTTMRLLTNNIPVPVSSHRSRMTWHAVAVSLQTNRWIDQHFGWDGKRETLKDEVLSRSTVASKVRTYRIEIISIRRSVKYKRIWTFGASSDAVQKYSEFSNIRRSASTRRNQKHTVFQKRPLFNFSYNSAKN